MISYFILGLIAVVIVMLLVRAYIYANPTTLANGFYKIGGIAVIVAAVVLSLRGLIWIGLPLGIWGISLLFRKRVPAGFSNAGGPQGRDWSNPNPKSSVKTAYLEMQLDHDTNDMEGLVLKGSYEGRFLSSMSLLEILELMGECTLDDPSSAQVLQAYLDKVHPDWRDHPSAQTSGSSSTQTGEKPLTRDEAYQILGLAPGASDEDIRQAHRALMKKFHPDQGGSTYLATKINEAKALLLKE